MSEAPERIWASKGSWPKFYMAPCKDLPLLKEYIRADIAQAEKEAAVAAAYEDAAEVCFDYSKDHGTGAFDRHSAECERRIRARANTDALAARDARVRAEALREAAEKANEVAQARLSDERDTALACRDRILALMEDQSDE